MIEVLYTHFHSMLGEDRWKSLLQQVPPECQGEILRFRRWQDRHARLFSRLILMEGLKKYGCGPETLREISSTAYGRPFLRGPVDFNISHSEEYVVCAVSDRGRVGIDIEQIRPVALEDFKRVLRPEEWREIERSERLDERFFTYWTIKESVIKAHGQGLSTPLQDVYMDQDQAILYDTRWFVHHLKIAEGYLCHLAVEREGSEISISPVLFSERGLTGSRAPIPTKKKGFTV
ncbi:MAG: 4'-phosphopantetheinyl transferase superfamily protein [Deltaproteobacteria bacterium]|nr:4'-phosphopantetheinyl transferase superfamily protein [Deltaproteobacteria bacterium]